MPIRFLEPGEHQAYRDWIAAHPDGFCIEIKRHSLPPMLHRVGCCCLGIAELSWVPIPVYCFASAEVRAWWDDSDLPGLSDEYVGSVEFCSLCEP